MGLKNKKNINQAIKIAKKKSKSTKANAQIQRKSKSQTQQASESKNQISFLNTTQNGAIEAKANHGIQPKLKVGPANDKYEIEADQMADKVMRMPASTIQQKRKQDNASLETPVIQRKFATGKKEETKNIQRKFASNYLSTTPLRNRIVQRKQRGSTKPTDHISSEQDELKIQKKANGERGPPSSDFSSTLSNSKGSGQAMDSNTQSFMNSRFGTDFSNVKIHTGNNASQMSNSINAKAFTHQNNIYFNKGQYQPNTHAGKTLLAHELTHTIQQGAVNNNAPDVSKSELALGTTFGKRNNPTFTNQTRGPNTNRIPNYLHKSNGANKVQAKIRIGQPDDRFEREADKMADKVVNKSMVDWNTEKRAADYSNNQSTDDGVLHGVYKAIELARSQEGLVKSRERDEDGNRFGWERLLEFFEIGTGEVDEHTKRIIKGKNIKLTTDPNEENNPFKLTSWCSIFTFWAFRKAGINLREWKSTSLPDNLKPIPFNSIPQVGDIAYRDAFSHYAIVTNVNVTGKSFTVDTINGNTSLAGNTLSGGEIQEKFSESKEKWTKKNKGGFLRVYDKSAQQNIPKFKAGEAPEIEQEITRGKNVIQPKTWGKEEQYNPYLQKTVQRKVETKNNIQPLDEERVQTKCKSCEEETVQPKLNTSPRGPPNGNEIQTKEEKNTISKDKTGEIKRDFWSSPLDTIGGAFSGALDWVGDKLDEGIDWIKEKLAKMAKSMPGYKLFSVVIGKEPITGKSVARNGRNFIDAGLSIIPNGADYRNKMIKDGSMKTAVTWLDKQIKTLDFTVADILVKFDRYINGLELRHITSPTETLKRGINVFRPYVEKVIAFAKIVAIKFLEIVKELALKALLVKIKKTTPWYPLLTVVLGEDPISGYEVERNGMNLLNGFILLHPEGEAQLAQMKESGALQRAAEWIDKSILRVSKNLNGIINGFIDLWKSFKIQDLLDPIGLLSKVKTIVVGPVTDLKNFALEVAAIILQFIKDALVTRLVEYARTIPGYHLLTVILGQDLFSNKKVKRSPENIIHGFMNLVPDGEAKFQELKQTGAINEAVGWIEVAVEKLDLSWSALKELFIEGWDSLSLKDIAEPKKAFVRIVEHFSPPLYRIASFVGKVVIKLVEIVLRIMGFPFALIGNIIRKAQEAYHIIKKDPIKFLRNMLKAVKQGFSQFFENILKHLMSGVGDWLLKQLEDTGITQPEDFSFRSILKLVFEILGVTKQKIFDKIKAKVGPKKWAKIEGTINALTGAWTFITDIFERGPIVIWEKIQEKLTGLWETVISAAKNWIMTKIVEKVAVKLLSFLDPTGIMAIVNSFIAFFRTIQSAIEYMKPLLQMLNNFFEGVVQIAQGNIQPAADFLEVTMGKGMSIMIGFLANQVGLGHVGEKIKEVIGGIQEKVDEGIQWLIDKAWEIGGSLLEKGKGLFKKGKEKQLSPKEKKAQILEGEKYILGQEKIMDTDRDSDLSQEQANSIAKNTEKKFTVFKKITPIANRDKWSYDYVMRKKGKVRGKKNVETEERFKIKKGQIGHIIDYNFEVASNGVKPVDREGENQIGYVASIRRVFGSSDKKPKEIAVMYRDQAFVSAVKENSPKETSARMAMVVGENGIDDLANINRKRTLSTESFAGFPFAVIGFLWQPIWTENGVNVSIDKVKNHYKTLSVADKQKLDIEEKNAYDQKIIPYGNINGKIASSKEVKGMITALKDKKHINEVFVQTGDSDAVKLNPTSKGSSTDATALDVTPAVEGLFLRYDKLLANNTIDGNTPVLASGGYSFEFKTNKGDVQNEDAVKVISSNLDNSIRNAMAKYNSRSVYLPEPNTIIKVTGRGAITLHSQSFGSGYKESEALVKSVLQENATARFVFDSRARLITKSERFKVKVGKTEVKVNATNVVGSLRDLNADEIKAIFEVDQSHAKKSVWINGIQNTFDIAELYKDFYQKDPSKKEEDLSGKITTGKTLSAQGLNQLVEETFPNLKLGYKPNRELLKNFSGIVSKKIKKDCIGAPLGEDRNHYFEKNGKVSKQLVSVAKNTGETIRKFMLENFYAQPKLKIGNPNSKHEIEADKVADEVVSRTTVNTLQSKCNECQKEEENSVQRKISPSTYNMQKSAQRTTDITNEKTESSIKNSKGKGRPMDSNTQTFMENRFGTDFSKVNIHTGTKANHLNNQIQAKAFTTGNDIYFNQGEYNPNTKTGKHLLAHELTHTIQQGKGKNNYIAKKSNKNPRKDLTITGLLRHSKQRNDTIYFDKNDDSILFSQEKKIAALTATLNSAKKIYLYGFASEEGTVKGNKTIIRKRQKAVKAMLKLYSINAKVDFVLQLSKSKDSFNYRRYRAVQISTVKLKTSKDNKNTTDRNCNAKEHTQIETTIKKAKIDITSARAKLYVFHRNSAKHKYTSDLLKGYFHSDEIKVVQKIFNILKWQLNNLEKLLKDQTKNETRRCASLDHNVCSTSYAAANPTKNILYCPHFFSSKDQNFKTFVFEHELGHYMPTYLKDISYSRNRLFRFQSTKESLDNTESFALLVNDLNKNKLKNNKNTVKKPISDQVLHCGKNETKLREVFARAARRNELAKAGSEQTYGNKKLTKYMGKDIEKYFGKINKYSFAGIVDRYGLLNNKYRYNKYRFNCLTTNPKNTSSSIKPVTLNKFDDFDISTSFFAMNKQDQIDSLGAEFTRLVPEIREKDRMAYPKLAYVYKTKFWKHSETR